MTADRNPESPPEVADAAPDDVLPDASAGFDDLEAPPDAETGTPPRRRRWTFRTAPQVGQPGRLRTPTLRFLRDIRAPSALQNPPFRRYWLSQIVALAGTWMQAVGQQLVVLSLTSSALAIGAINVVSAIPLLLFSLSGGVIADRFDRRWILMVTMSMLGVLSLVYAWLIATDRMEYWHILVIAAITGTVVAFELPAGQAFISELVPRDDLPQAIALNSASFNSTRIVGPALAATAIGALGLASAFVVNAFTLLAPIGTLARLKKFMSPRPRMAKGSSGLGALKDGLRYVRANEGIMGLVVLQGTISFFVSPNLLVLLPLYVTDVLGGGDSWVGIMLSAMGAGSLVGSLTLLRGSRLESAAARRLRIAIAGLTIGIIWIALAQSPLMAVPGVMIAGFAFSSGNSQIMTRIQQLAPDELRGRVLSLNMLSFNGVMPFATIGISGLSQVIGQHVVMAASAMLLGVAGVYLWRRYVWMAFQPTEVPGAVAQHAL
jgi:MFS family permease